MLEMHRAERADTLVDALAGVLAEPAGDPFSPEIVAVPERGVERWLAQRLAHRLGSVTGSDGVCANIEFPPPSALLERAVAAVTGVHPEFDVWAPARSVWPLLEVLDEALASDDPRFAGPAAHLSGGGEGRRYGLARKLAGLFAGYATHRPALLHGWLAGDTSATPPDLQWQAELWRRLHARIGEPGPAERLDCAVEELRGGAPVPALPDRLSLFGPTRLAAEHLSVIDALAVHRDVHLWLPHPSPAMWDAVRADRPSHPPLRARDRSAARVENPLLRSLGRDVRELALRLPVGGLDTHHPGPAGEPTTVLARLQAALATDAAPPPPDERPLLDPGDRSVAVHSCHGPDRQVEVLREVLLGLLEADDTLEPRDVIVMCPDIEEFAPLITASFGLAPDADGGLAAQDLHPGHTLRVRLADRALRQANPLLGTVSALLELADARLTSSQVLDLVGSGPVRRRFRLDDDALERIGELVASAGVRWGLDAAHRRPYRLESFGQNTWSAGLDRMLLGVAMAQTPGEPAWLGTALPLDEIDSSDVDLVGRLAEIMDRLGAALASLTGPQPLMAWVAALNDALSSLTDTPSSEDWQVSQARAELAEVVDSAGPQAATVDLALADVRGLLIDRLRGRPSRANFRTGTLTVATLVPMRAVPHRVVCLLGCDDGVFPRAGATDGDDVLARDPVVGERDARAEDRQLLLDAVGSATEHLVVVYSGADERSGVRRPPAVPIGELLDAVDGCVRTADGTLARDRVVVRHPLQPFDRRNFTGGTPFSFDRVSLHGARAAAGPRAARVLFPAAPLPDPAPGPGETPGEVELDHLTAFVEHPVRAFLRQRVRMAPVSEEEEPADGLPVELDGLAKWRIGERLLSDRLAGADAGRSAQAEWRRGELPPGGIGTRMLADVAGRVDPLVAVARALGAADTGSQDVTAVLSPEPAVVGTVPGIGGDTVLRIGYSSLKARHRLRAWVQLLALTVAHPDRRWRAVTVGRGAGGVARSTLGPVEPERARGVLADLVAVRREGLREPLPLPTETAAVYARARCQGANARNAFAAADAEWSRFDWSEWTDAALVFVHGEKAPLTTVTGPDHSRFAELAARLWVPLLDAETMDAP